MKKFLLSLFAFAAATIGASAASVTFDFTTNDYGLPNDGDTYVTVPATITQGDVSITLKGNDNAWRMWTDGLREYNKNNPSFTVSADGQNITKVSWTVVSGATFALEGTTTNITEWTGSASSVTFVGTATSNKAVKTITVEYGEGGGGNTDPDPGTGDNPGGGETNPTGDITAFEMVGNATDNVALDGQTFTVGIYNFSFAKNDGATAPQYYNSAKDARLYAKNTMTITSGATMTKMVFTLSDVSKLGSLDVSTGTMAYDTSAKTVTWTGEATEVVFTVSAKAEQSADPSQSGQFRWSAVSITSNSDVEVSAPPVISPANGTVIDPEDGIVVTITAADGAAIYYTTDGSNPTTSSDKYEAEFVLMHAATVKAIAVEEGKAPSAVVSATYKEPAASVKTIAEWLEKADDANVVVIAGPVTVTYEYNNQYLYVTDNTASLQIYANSKNLPSYTPGTQLTNIAGTYALYGQAPQMVPDVQYFGAGTTGAAPEATTVAIDQITSGLLSDYVMLQNVLITSSGNNYYAQSGSNQIQLYNRFNVSFPTDVTAGYDVYGIVSSYNGTLQVYPIAFALTGQEIVTYEVATIAEWLEKADGDETNTWTITGQVRTVYQNGSNLYVQDLEAPYAGMLVYGNLGKTYEPGTLLSGIQGKWTNYYSTIEFTAVASSFTDGTPGSDVQWTTVDLEDVTSGMQNMYVELEKVTISNYDATAKTFVITDAKDATLEGYNKWDRTITIPSDDTKVYNVFGFISYYQAKDDPEAKVQFYPTQFVEASGVDAIVTDNAAAEYYTIDGVRVVNPENGIYIVRQGNKVSKVIIRK